MSNEKKNIGDEGGPFSAVVHSVSLAFVLLKKNKLHI